MPSSLIEEAKRIHQIIVQQTNSSVSHVGIIKNMFSKVASSFEGLSAELLKHCRQFNRKLEPISLENSVEHSLSQFLNNVLRETSSRFHMMSREMRQQHDSLEHFSADLESTTLRFQNTASQNIEAVQEALDRISDIEKCFKQRNLQKRKSLIMRIEESQYRGEVAEANEQWAEIQVSYSKLLEEIDFFLHSKLQFTKKLQIQFLRVDNKVLNNLELEGKLKVWETESHSRTSFEEQVVAKVERELGRSQLLKPLKTFDCLLLRQQSVAQKQDSTLVKQIQAFCQLFLAKSSGLNSLWENTRGEILKSSILCQYFLACLCSKLHTEINLPLDKYHEILTIVKYIFANQCNSKSNQTMLYSLLYLGVRITNQGSYLIEELSRYEDYWNNQERWIELFQFLAKLHLQASQRTKHRSSVTIVPEMQSEVAAVGQKKRNSFPGSQKSLPSIATNRDSSGKNVTLASLLGKKKNTFQFNQDLAYETLKQINNYLCRLKLPTDFSINLIRTISNQVGISEEKVEKILMHQHKSKRNSLGFQYHSLKAVIKRRDTQFEQYSRAPLLFAVQKALVYLPLQDIPIRLRLVCRQWQQKLKIQLLRRYLRDEANLNVINKIRAHLYEVVVPQAYSRQVYRKMLSHIPEDYSFKDTISMDVRRSLNWNTALRPDLEELLGVFAVYNQKIGYLQGMNYQCEHLLKLCLPKHRTFCLFEFLVRNHFSQMFSPGLGALKIRLYQFMRLLQLYLPKIYHHFQNQHVQSEHFLVSWAITMWGELPGDVVWILWDGFLVDGWKWWMQVALWSLALHEKQILELGFQDILRFFGEMPNSSFFKCQFNDFYCLGVDPLKIKQDIKSRQVTDEMLRLIEAEYLQCKRKYAIVLGELN